MNYIQSNVTVLILLFFVNYGSAHASANAAFTIDDLGNTEFFGNVKICGDTLVSVPIGAVIDWWRPDSSFGIPQKFSICDGRKIVDPESPYVNSDLPNLIGKFTRGASLNDIGKGGGDDRPLIDIRTTEDGRHYHGFLSSNNTTRLISNRGDNPGRGEYMIQDMDAWTDKEHIVVAGDGYWSERSGNHRHDLPPTDHADAHGHEVHFEVDTVPCYVGLLKLMRIK